MMGSLAGDIIGSIYEFNNIKRKDFPLWSPQSDFTDDSVMTVATAYALLNNQDFGAVYREFGQNYPGRGYGTMFKQWLNRTDMGAYNSFGNGSAMRVSPIGWYANNIEEALELARKSALCTHNHPEGIKGAQATVLAVYGANNGWSKDRIKTEIEEKFEYNLDLDYQQLVAEYEFNESSQSTVPQAIYCFLISTDFEDAIRTAISIGGDSDTVACITGSIAEAFYGKVLYDITSEVMSRIPKEWEEIILTFTDMYKQKSLQLK